MEITEHIEVLRREGALLADAAGRSGPGAPVPTCPEWAVRDLVHHTGGVHRWAATYVRDGLTEPMGAEAEQAVYGPMPEDADLVRWYREAYTRLTDALESADADLVCWTFFRARSPLAFWARRQAHETTIHRVDAESAAGGGLSPIPSALAVDGVDELLGGFHTRRRSRVRTDQPRVLRIRAVDAEGRTGGEAGGQAGGEAVWSVYLSADAPRVTREADGAADCTLSGPADALYLALWNRGPRDLLRVEGDPGLLDLWAERSAVI